MDIPKCLRPGCGRDARERGLCANCIQSARALVKRGITTWEALEKAGKSKPRKLQHAKGGAIQQWFLNGTT